MRANDEIDDDSGDAPSDVVAWSWLWSPRWSSPRFPGGLALGIIVAVAALLSVLLHRNGHARGDDFALYLLQARSLFDGNIAEVVADNRFAVVNSTGAFGPNAYPWGLPLLLSPFVHLWDLDYNRLKLVEVAAFCVWLVLVHGIVRRRVGRTVALAVTAVLATAPALLSHTGQLLSEFPHAAAVAVFVWWLDRMRARGALVTGATRDLVVLGVLVTVAFNFRREGLVLIGAVGVIQVVELAVHWRRARFSHLPWRTLAMPHAAFAASAAGFQLLLPSMLLPNNGGKASFVDDRLGGYPRVLTQHLGLGAHPAIGVFIVALAIAGAIIGIRRRPGLDGPLAAVAVLSAIAVSTHFRMVGRYYFQITPWVLYFATVPIVGIVVLLWRERDRRFVATFAAAPLMYLIAVHAAVLPGDIDDARRFNRSSELSMGPTDPTVTPVFDAVARLTRPDDVIAFYRARTMTLYTDRRAIQTTLVDRISQRADYFAQQRGSDFYQPLLSEAQGRDLGYEIVWSDTHWILWEVPDEVTDVP
jgi:hypothetical protein